MNRRVVITGMGWVTPLGCDLEGTWKRLLNGDSAVGPTTIFDASAYPTTFSAEVRDFDLAAALGDRYDAHQTASRNAGFAIGAALQAWAHSGLDPATLDPEMVGVYLGAGEGPIDSDHFIGAACAGWNKDTRELDAMKWAERAYATMSASREFEQDPNSAACHLAYLFDAQGPNLNTLTACSASTQAIGEASCIIQRGDADVMISGGAHSMIHPLGVTGFNLLTALSTRNDSWQTASRPFDRTRDGFVLGEGSGILILEEHDRAVARGATIYGEICGYGSTADAFRVTDIHKEARGATAAMRAALDAAEMTPDQIDYISAHGTSTTENDKLETLAINKVFGEQAPKTPVSSVKSMFGHLVAAAGSVELITCLLAIRDGMIPPTINHEHTDPDCNLDYVPNQARKADVKACLSNSFGFGGQNDTLIVRKR